MRIRSEWSAKGATQCSCVCASTCLCQGPAVTCQARAHSPPPHPPHTPASLQHMSCPVEVMCQEVTAKMDTQGRQCFCALGLGTLLQGISRGRPEPGGPLHNNPLPSSTEIPAQYMLHKAHCTHTCTHSYHVHTLPCVSYLQLPRHGLQPQARAAGPQQAQCHP